MQADPLTAGTRIAGIAPGPAWQICHRHLTHLFQGRFLQTYHSQAILLLTLCIGDCCNQDEGTGSAFFSSGGAADPVVGLHDINVCQASILQKGQTDMPRIQAEQGDAAFHLVRMTQKSLLLICNDWRPYIAPDPRSQAMMALQPFSTFKTDNTCLAAALLA